MVYNINLLKLTYFRCPLGVYCFAVCIQVGSDPEPLAWSFNLSHQGDYAVLAAERGLQVGVDIMKTTMPGSMSLYYLILSDTHTRKRSNMLPYHTNDKL